MSPETNWNFLSYPRRPPNSDFAAGDCLPLEVVTGHPHEPSCLWATSRCHLGLRSMYLHIQLMDGCPGTPVQCYGPEAGYCSQAGLGWVLERS